jgi:hypothetical protein
MVSWYYCIYPLITKLFKLASNYNLYATIDIKFDLPIIIVVNGGY